MINNNRCERCFKKTNTFSMSIFEPKMICMECIEKEKDHPDYKHAKKAELDAVKAGNYNFEGIGYRKITKRENREISR